jgi:hypothetical protein
MTEAMALDDELQLLDPVSACVKLRAAGAGARGFLGLDPVIQNDPLLTRELARTGAQLFSAGDAVVGAVPNQEQPRQAFVATTSADPGPVRALLHFLTTYQRCTSFLALSPAGSPAVAALAGCGFQQVGVLREHRYANYGYQDVLVHFVRAEGSCRS